MSPACIAAHNCSIVILYFVPLPMEHQSMGFMVGMRLRVAYMFSFFHKSPLTERFFTAVILYILKSF